MIVCVVLFRDNPAELNYDTSGNTEQLAILEGKRISLVVHHYDQGMLVGAKPLSHSTAIAVTAAQKDNLISTLGSIFDVTDVTTDEPLPACLIQGDRAEFNCEPGVLDPNSMANILVSYSYGYDVVDTAEDQILERLFPEDFVAPMKLYSSDELFMDPSIESYYLVVNTSILDQRGQVIWGFYGKAIAHPGDFEQTALDHILSQARIWQGILEPGDEELASIMTAMNEEYTAYLLWLLRADLNGTEEKNYFDAYLGDSKSKHIDIYPALDAGHYPVVKEIADKVSIKRKENASWLLSTWERARSGRWLKFGEWAQAWAAFKLSSGSFLATVGFVGLGLLVLPKVDAGTLIGFLMWYGFASLLPIFIGFWGISTYFLLEALL